MECPVCYRKPSSGMFHLECGHRMCVTCAISWLLKNPTCPMCRGRCLLFCKRTRSQSKAYEIMTEALAMWHNLRHQHNSEIPMREFCLYIDTYFMNANHRKLWYRPELVDYKRQFKVLCNSAIVAGILNHATIPEIDTVVNFLRS